jgi:rhodanese-related sulfurtransferase
MPTLIAFVLLLALLALVVLTLAKVTKVHKASFELLTHAQAIRAEVEAQYGQLQWLAALQHRLALERPLPPTRGWAGSPDFLYHLAQHIDAQRPQVVVECSSGVSTVVAARCLQRLGQGHVYSLEHDALYAEKTRQLLRDFGLDAWATVLHAPLVKGEAGTLWYDASTLPADIGPIELLVVDGPPMATGRLARYPALPRLLGRMAERFAVFVDDADRPDEREMVARWQREVPSLAVRHEYCEKGLAVATRGAL